MGQKDTPDIRVLVGVEGGVGIDSGSGQRIAKTLAQIARNISVQKTPLITFDVDFQSTVKKIYKQLNEIAKSIKVEPIDLQIRTNQSSIGNSSNNAKPNVAVYTEEKQRLADIANQKKRDIELTKQQAKETKKLNEVVKQFSFLGSSEQSSKYNSILNNTDKLGLSDLENQFREVEQSGNELQETFKRLKGDMPEADFAKQLIGDDASDEMKKLLNDTKNYHAELEKIEKLSKQDSSTFVKDSRHAKDAKDLENLITTMKKYEQTNDKFKNNSGLLTQFQGIVQAADALKASGDFSKIDVDGLRQKFVALDGTITDMGLKGQTAFGKLRAQMEKLGVYLSASAIMMGAWRQVKQMTNNVIELDNAMTELKKVTDETDASYSKFLDNAEVRAKKLGATLTDTIRSTADAARMGYSLNEAESLSDTFNIYKNVGDGVRDIEQASSSVISTMKAFGIEAKNSMQIVDAYNEVSNNFAVRSDEIGLAVADMGAAFAGAGNSMEESIAVYTGMNEIIQDWSKSSTAMRTIAARLRNTAGELEELGIDSEGAAESVTKLQTQLLNLTKGKVDIMASPDEFKNTTQILRELSAVWDSLTDKDRADVTRLVSGTRQQSTLQAVLTNWEQVETAITTAMDSSGSAYAENEKCLDSVKGKAAQFQAQYEALSNTIIDSDLIKFAYDSGTGLLGFLDVVIKNLGTIPTLAAVAAGSLSAISNKGGYAPLIKAA